MHLWLLFLMTLWWHRRCERLCCMHDWQDVPFPWELQLFSPSSPPDQRVIHPRGAEVMSADRWKLTSSFSIPEKSTPNNLPSDLPPSVSSGASLNGLQCLHIVTSCGLAHTHIVCRGSLVCFSNFGLGCQSPQVVHGTMFVWVENRARRRRWRTSGGDDQQVPLRLERNRSEANFTFFCHVE